MRSDGYEHRIQDTFVRLGSITWCVFVFIASLLGDTIILLATFKYKAIKLHKVVIAVMQHLAINDLLLAVFKVAPLTLKVLR